MPMFTRRADKAAALEKVPLFAGFSQANRMEIARYADEVTLKPKETLTVQGKSGAEAFLIVKGSVTTRRNGRKVRTSGPGEVIGEMALLDAAPRSATCTADEETVVLVMSQRDFQHILDRVPRLGRKLLVTLSQRLREAEKQV